MNAAVGVLEGLALFDGDEHELQVRVARYEGDIYYDLGDEDWKVVRITSSGWDIDPNPPILFRRHSHQRPQVPPSTEGELDELFDFVHVAPEYRLLLKVLVVSALVPDIPRPVMLLHGEKGAGKSMSQRFVRALLDPSATELLSFPRDLTGLAQQLSHHYAPAYDNVDALSPWMSDALCRAVTGEGFTKRALYTDDEDVIYSYRRIIMLNGINIAAQRPDLLDRSVLLSLERIPRADRLEERSLREAFGEAQPRLFGAMLDALAGAMRLYPFLELDQLERMADFTKWGAAITMALGEDPQVFLEAYSANVKVQTFEAVDGDVVGAAVLALMEKVEHWSGASSELLASLESVGVTAQLLRRSPTGKVDTRGWPGGPHILSRRLNALESNLAELGILLTRSHADRRVVTLTRTDPEARK